MAMSDDKIRAEFEKWAKDYYGYASDDLAIERNFYVYSTVEECWQNWQAAYDAGQKAEREAIFIEWENGEIMAAEVERLRAELAQLRKDWCDDDEAIKQQALRVLPKFEVEGDSVHVPRMGELAEMMADTALRYKEEGLAWMMAAQDKECELAAAKAASVVPVKWKSVERFFKPFLSDADLGNKWGIEFWFDTKEQREQFHKWLKKRGGDERR